MEDPKMPEPLRRAVHQLVSEAACNLQEILQSTAPDEAHDSKGMSLSQVTDVANTLNSAAMLIAAYCQRAGTAMDDPRVRWITQYLPGDVARELFATRDASGGDQQRLVIFARALGHGYFLDGDHRAHDVHTAFSDV